MTNDSVHQTNARPRVPLGTPTDISFVALLLKHHNVFEERESFSREVVLCRCTPQVWRTREEHHQHVAAIILQRLTDMLDEESTQAEIDAERAAGLLCEETSLNGSPCIRAVGHDGDHQNARQFMWNDETNRKFLKDQERRR